MNVLLIAAAILIVALFFLRRANGWTSWWHIAEVSGYGTALGAMAGLVEDGLSAVFSALVTGVWIGGLYWLLIPSDSQRDRRLGGERTSPAQRAASALVLLALVGVVVYIANPGIWIPLSVALLAMGGAMFSLGLFMSRRSQH